LYKIPKTVEKFAERHALFSDRLADIDYSSQAAMLERACGLNERMQSIESEADRLLLVLYGDLFSKQADAAMLMVRKDLFELLEKAIDRCRDAGNGCIEELLTRLPRNPT